MLIRYAFLYGNAYSPHKNRKIPVPLCAFSSSIKVVSAVSLYNNLIVLPTK